MLAAVYRSGHFVVDEVPEPTLGLGQVKVQVEATGICGSDLSAARHTEQFLNSARDSGTALYDFDPTRDLVFGHEYAGRVIEVSPGVENVAVGDLVAGYAIVNAPDGSMRLCGYSNEYTGGFAERMVVQAVAAHRVPAGLDAKTATLAEPLSVGEMSAQRSHINPDNGAIVIGAGSVGLGVIAALGVRGVGPIVVVEPSPRRREMAHALGATVTLHPHDADPVDVWRSHVTVSASLVAWECTGKAGMINRLMHIVPPKTRIMVDGSCMVDDTMRPVVGTYKGLLIDFGYGDTTDAYETSLQRIAAGTIAASNLITAEVGLDEVGNAFDWLSSPNEHVKIVVRPGHTAGTGLS
jgi:threonine dehydrogenase-like Zn-dependent dehydrogenase